MYRGRDNVEYDCSNVEYLFMKMVDRDEHNIQTISEGPLELTTNRSHRNEMELTRTHRNSLRTHGNLTMPH